MRKCWFHLFVLSSLLGACQTPVPAISAPVQAPFKTLSIPDSIDLRPPMTPVKNQGERNTCNAFAATALMEFLIQNKTGKTVDLSESYNYWLGKTQTLNTPFLREAYAHMDGLAGFLAVQAYRFGSLAESDWPYESTNWLQRQDKRCKTTQGQSDTACFTGLPPRSVQPLPYRLEPVFVDRQQMGAFLLKEKKPLVFNILWVQSALNQATGEFRMPTVQEAKSAPGHVILLVGYETKTRQFLFRNSYGPGWGQHGYGRIPEDYVMKYCEVCPYLSSIKTHPKETQDFIHQGSQGVSGKLIH